jgi:hypothetical protein
MPDGDPPRDSDVDDWFAGLDNETPPRTRRAAGVEPSDGTSASPDAFDDWVGDEHAPPRVEESPRSEGFTVRLGTLVAVGGIVLVLLLVAGLALGGAFSGGGKSPTTTSTTTASTTTNQTPSTTTTNQTPSTTTTTAAPTHPVVPAPATTLKPGDQGAQVKRLQRALLQLGYAVGAVDGDYGTSTEAAVTSFQKASNLTADGVLGPATLRALKRALVRQPQS